ncbi:MAG: hypothetical protein PVSMB6_09830 [Steroidobacteraceae bacterium]
MDMPLTARKSPTTLKSTPITNPADHPPQPAQDAAPGAPPARPREIGGSAGPEPTRFGDWEKNGRCIDF